MVFLREHWLGQSGTGKKHKEIHWALLDFLFVQLRKDTEQVRVTVIYFGLHDGRLQTLQ